MTRPKVTRHTEHGRTRLDIAKNNTCTRDVGCAGENCAMNSLVIYCVECDSELKNANDDNPNNEGFDLKCINPRCSSVIQVKSYGPNNHNQLTSDYVLKQAGDYRIMLDTMNNYDLRYFVIFYDNNKDIVRSVLSDTVSPKNIVGKYGQNKCRIRLDNVYDVEYI